MKVRADILVYSADDQLKLVVEIKNKVGATPEWASEMRQEIMLRGAFSNTIYFLLVTPEYLFLWRDHTLLEALPNYCIGLRDVLGKYFRPTNLPITAISGYSLEIAATSWLNNLMVAPPKNMSETVSEFLVSSGLLNVIQGGSIAAEATV